MGYMGKISSYIKWILDGNIYVKDWRSKFIVLLSSEAIAQRKAVLKKFTKFLRKHLYQSFFFIKSCWL